MPWDKSRYPDDWPAIRAAILERAGNRCEWCGVANGAVGARDKDGAWHDEHYIHNLKSDEGEFLFPDGCPLSIRIVLTVAHLDHDTTHNDPANLAALCQKCHLTHDAKLHAVHARITRAGKRGQLFLPGF